MLTPREVFKAREKNYKFMHIGAVQVGIKLQDRERINCSVLCALQDNIIIYFKKSWLRTLEASLCNQVAYFNYFLNFTTSLKDVAYCLRLRVKIYGIAMKENMQQLAIEYRVSLWNQGPRYLISQVLLRVFSPIQKIIQNK